jgi:manganese/iron transport system permease protein
MSALDLAYWTPVLLGGLVAGASCGTMGVYITGMRLSFLGICMAHAALAGAVAGNLAGLHGQAVLLPALAGAMLVALLLGLADPRRWQLDGNLVLGVLFSLTMGLAFLGMGLADRLGRAAADSQALLWGNLAFCRWPEFFLMLGAALLLWGFILLFGKEMCAILCSRTEAQAAGIHATFVWCVFLLLAAVLLTVNFQTVGGLMIYSLITNPAVAAFQVGRGLRQCLPLAAGFGALSGGGGFLLAAWTDLPVGAVIVLVSSVLVLAALLAAGRRRG